MTPLYVSGHCGHEHISFELRKSAEHALLRLVKKLNLNFGHLKIKILNRIRRNMMKQVHSYRCTKIIKNWSSIIQITAKTVRSVIYYETDFSLVYIRVADARSWQWLSEIVRV